MKSMMGVLLLCTDLCVNEVYDGCVIVCVQICVLMKSMRGVLLFV